MRTFWPGLSRLHAGRDDGLPGLTPPASRMSLPATPATCTGTSRTAPFFHHPHRAALLFLAQARTAAPVIMAAGVLGCASCTYGRHAQPDFVAALGIDTLAV